MSLAGAKYALYMAIKNKGCELTTGEICLLLDLAKDEDVKRQINIPKQPKVNFSAENQYMDWTISI